MNFIEYEELDSTQLEAKRYVKKNSAKKYQCQKISVPKNISAKKYQCQKISAPKNISAKKYQCQNNSAKNNCANNGTVIIAKNQTNGIGTHGRKWISKKDESITFTLILEPNCNLEKLENFTLEIAECVVDTFQDLYGIKLNIKNPNDIVFNGKKIGGILTETQVLEGMVKFIFIGIGLNTNQAEFAPEIEEIATSVKNEFGIDIDNRKVIESIVKKLRKLLQFF